MLGSRVTGVKKDLIRCRSDPYITVGDVIRYVINNPINANVSDLVRLLVSRLSK